MSFGDQKMHFCRNLRYLITCKTCACLIVRQWRADLKSTWVNWEQGCGVEVIRSRRFSGGVGFLTTLGAGVGFFCPTSDVHLDHFLHHTPKLGILGEMVISFETFVETEISCCAPRFPLILTAKLHSLYVKESGVGNFGKVGVGSRKFWKGRSRKFYLRLHKPDL